MAAFPNPHAATFVSTKVPTMKRRNIYVFSASLVLMYGVLSWFAKDEAELTYQLYCKNVAQWHHDAAQEGVDPYSYAGHPNYKSITCPPKEQ